LVRHYNVRELKKMAISEVIELCFRKWMEMLEMGMGI
jgi:hypothetical protein